MTQLNQNDLLAFQAAWKKYSARTEIYLEKYISTYCRNDLIQSQTELFNAISYACLNGGKRLRAALVYASAEAYNIPLEKLDAIACAIELIHCYSLVHDDMPEMDNDEYRRGKLSTHAKFGQANALLVGDNLQTLAFELLSSVPELDDLDAKSRLDIIQILAKNSGTQGMIGGQAIDLAIEQKKIGTNQSAESKLKILESLHLMKTGALISAAIEIGAIAGLASPQDISTLKQYATHLGLLFQITDDILDETSTAEKLGKSIGKDQLLDKMTYTTLLGLDNAKKHAINHCNLACEALNNLSHSAEFFKSMALFIKNREH